MLVRDYMTRDVVTMKPKDTARAARELMARRRIQQLPIVARGKLVGIVTDRDLRDAYPAAAVSYRGPEIDDYANRITLDSLMTETVLSVGPDTTVAAAAEILRKERIGALPVLDRGSLVGILTRSDLLRALIDVAGTISRSPVERQSPPRKPAPRRR